MLTIADVKKRMVGKKVLAIEAYSSDMSLIDKDGAIAFFEVRLEDGTKLQLVSTDRGPLGFVLWDR